MKKTLIALAAVAATTFSASAMAQATISGTFGAGYQAQQDGLKKGLVQTDSSIRFTASEDLGGGLRASASVQFTAGALRNTSGTDAAAVNSKLGKEDSSVSLSGGFGTVAFANTRSSNQAIAAHVFPSWMPVTSFYAGVDSRSDIDTFAYVSPQIMPGLTVGYTFVEATEGAETSAGKINVLTANYTAGPLFATVAFKDYNAAAEAGGAEDRFEGAVTYDLGVARVGLGYGQKTSASGDNLTAIGVSAPVGAAVVGINYAKRGDVKFYDAGVKYNLSKRTSLNIMTGKLTGGSSAGKQYRVGVLHTF